jgi:hypothetical protein
MPQILNIGFAIAGYLKVALQRAGSVRMLFCFVKGGAVRKSVFLHSGDAISKVRQNLIPFTLIKKWDIYLTTPAIARFCHF